MAEAKSQNDVVKLVNVSKESLGKQEDIKFKCNGVLYTVKDSIRVSRAVAEHGLKISNRHIDDGAGVVARRTLVIEELPVEQRNPNLFAGTKELESTKSELEKSKDEISSLNEKNIKLTQKIETLEDEVKDLSKKLKKAEK